MASSRLVIPDGANSSIVGMPSQGEMIRDPEPFYQGSTMPQAYTGMYDSMPSSSGELMARATDEGGGAGPSQYKITNNLVLRAWRGRFEYMVEILEGQLMFTLKTDQYGRPGEVAAVNLYNLNKMLSKGYKEAMRVLEREDIGEDLPYLLSITPTWNWYSISQLMDILKLGEGGETSSFSSLRYLSSELFFDRFLLAGWLEGTQPRTSMMDQRPARVGGVIENIENVWSDNLQQGEKLYLILKRTYNREKDSYGAFAYHPWAGYGHPPSDVLVYKDISGHMRLGQVMYVGEILQWTENEKFNDENIAMYIGLTEDVKDLIPPRQARSLRIAYTGNPRNGISWYFY